MPEGYEWLIGNIRTFIFIFSRLLGGAFLSHIHARITSDLRESGAKAHEGSGKMLAIPCPSPLFRKHMLPDLCADVFQFAGRCFPIGQHMFYNLCG